MNVIEETIDAVLDSSGQLRLTHQPHLPPGPVRVTIRVAAAVGPQRGLADVIREIAAEQRARGFPGRSSEDATAEDDARLVEEAERDRELDAARPGSSSGGPQVLYRDGEKLGLHRFDVDPVSIDDGPGCSARVS